MGLKIFEMITHHCRFPLKNLTDLK